MIGSSAVEDKLYPSKDSLFLDADFGGYKILLYIVFYILIYYR